MKVKPTIGLDETTGEIISSTILTTQTKQLIMEYIQDTSIHNVLNITFKELLLNVWDIIRTHDAKDDILGVLNDEINDVNLVLIQSIEYISSYRSNCSIALNDLYSIGSSFNVYCILIAIVSII